jgi:hypothetical protein
VTVVMNNVEEYSYSSSPMRVANTASSKPTGKQHASSPMPHIICHATLGRNTAAKTTAAPRPHLLNSRAAAVELQLELLQIAALCCQHVTHLLPLRLTCG